MSECFIGGVGKTIYTLSDCSYNSSTHVLTLPSGLTWNDVQYFSIKGSSAEAGTCSVVLFGSSLYMLGSGKSSVALDATPTSNTATLYYSGVGFGVTSINVLCLVTK